jgi:hypothetical protein
VNEHSKTAFSSTLSLSYYTGDESMGVKSGSTQTVSSPPHYEWSASEVFKTMTLLSPASKYQNTRSAPKIRSLGVALSGALLLATAIPLNADELATPVMQQGDGESTMNLPDHGQGQSAVRERFGQPRAVDGPVGQPPITQWHYANFVVYFEYDNVIHAVAKPNR